MVKHFTEEQKKWLLNNCEKYNNFFELTDEFNSVFNADDCSSRIKSFCNRHNLKTKNVFTKEPKKRDYNEEEINWLKKNRNNFDNTQEMVKVYNELFEVKRSFDSIIRICSINKIRREGYREIIDNKEYDEWLKENYNKYPTKEIIKIVKDKFGIDTSFSAIQNKINRQFGLIRERRGKFLGKEIGHEYVYKQSVYIKVKDDKYWGKTDKKPQYRQLNYRRKANVMYEQYHNVKLDDKTQYVVCIDQDMYNFDKDNLMLLNVDEFNKYRSTRHWYDFKGKKLNKLFLNIIRLDNIVKKARINQKE